MRFSDAKKLHGGKSPIYRQEEIYNISIEDRNVFVLCMDGHLYHHTALKVISDN